MRADSLIALAQKEKIEYMTDEAMALHTSFKIGGNADIFLRPDNTDQLKSIISHAKKENIPCFILGCGSNLLVSDKGIEGAVVSTAGLSEIRLVSETEIFAGAGATLASLCRFARDNSLSGLEFAYGIPGSVGGALYMNAGAYGGDMSMVASSAESIGPESDTVTRNADGLGLSYRKSIFKENGETVTGVTFRLTPGDREEITEAMNGYMAKRKASQPLDFPSAGSTFKRPEGYFAAALIDECGLKGCRVGGAMVSEKHAGFVINYSKATCDDVLGLVRVIKDTVWEKKQVGLELEVICVGR